MSGGDDRSDDAGRDPREEPLGDLAEEVRQRTGGRRDEEPRGGRADGAEREGPLADVASKVDERRRDAGASDPFESVDVGELDGERLWEQLASDDAAETSSATGSVVDAESESLGDDRDVRTIPKSTCHGCPHFGDPPELGCTREGTEILSMPDVDHFRVVDCPMVVAGEEDVASLGLGADDAEE